MINILFKQSLNWLHGSLQGYSFGGALGNTIGFCGMSSTYYTYSKTA